MSKYTKIPHPLLSDSGTCQSERYPALLNPSSTKIDDQQLEDILNFINKYSRFINFYEAKQINESRLVENYEINISNWKELFSKSIPFQLASLSKIDVNELSFNLSRILQLVDEFPSKENFQILLDFIFTELILIFETSLNNVKKVETSFGIVLQRTMSSSLREPLENFISLTKKLVEREFLPGLNFAEKITLGNWDIVELNSIPESPLNSTYDIVQALERNATIFLNELKTLATKTSNFLPQALYPNEESQEGKIGPHIGLLIAFLNLQKRFVNDLNDITRRHLLYFYNDVLQIKGKPARPDETFIVFELQKQVENSYFLPKGTKVKDGKDDNKADIIFALDKDIVLDKAEIKELRTLYVNPVQGYLNKIAGTSACDEGDLEKFTEGLYIAPKANSLDGVEEDFTENPKNWPTLGAKESKLLVRENLYEDHPEARVGFVLSSPVLLLNEGKRKITVTLYCKDESEGVKTAGGLFSTDQNTSKPSLNRLNELKNNNSIELFEGLVTFLWRNGSKFIDFNQTFVDENGDTVVLFASDEIDAIKTHLGLDDVDENGNEVIGFNYNVLDLIDLEEEGIVALDNGKGDFLLSQMKFFNQVSSTDLNSFDDDFKAIVLEFLYVRPFNVYLSGEKEWLKVVNKDITITLKSVSGDPNPPPGSETANLFFEIEVELKEDFPAVTFSDPEALGVEVDTSQPSMKIEIDPNYKVLCDSNLFKPCCTLSHGQEEKKIAISPYHFLKDLTITNSCIDVEVCGIKNIIVQNDESLQDVNGLVYPFGTRPRFEHNPAAPYSARGSNFFIGSQEVFCKNWKKFLVNINWKDKPYSFCDHYIGYEDITKGIATITGDDFKIRTALLENGKWLNFNQFQNAKTRNNFLFNKDENTSRDRNKPDICDRTKYNYQRIFDYQRENNPDFLGSQYRKKEISGELLPFSPSTRDGFLRLTLSKLDFQHSQYPFILARQMMAFGKLEADGKSVYVPGAVYYSGNIKNNTPTNIIFNNVKAKIRSIGQIFNQVIVICKFIDTLEPELNVVTSAILSNPNNLTLLRSNLTGLVSSFDDLLDPNDLASQIINSVTAIFGNISDAIPLTASLVSAVNRLKAFPGGLNPILDDPPLDDINKQNIYFGSDYLGDAGVNQIMIKLREFLDEIKAENAVEEDLGVVIPKEPWTPIIKEISIDYTAKAERTDMQLVHLYPFENTYKTEEITANPSLFPIFEDEGTLFIGLDNLTKGNTLNLLFNLAEATANTEMSKADIQWAYLKNNVWKPLEIGFAILNDSTQELTKSGIVEISVPIDISKTGNSIMSSDYFWIKAATKENSKAVCETISIHTQAAKIKAVFSPENDLKRLSTPLDAEKINRLNTADTSIKKVSQPIPSYNGRPPEGEAPALLYRRISERLRHKGRAIARFGYERITLENFPQIFKAKTINHTLGLPGTKFVRDLEIVAPGHVVVAVIPNIKELNSGNILEPRVPLSQLGQIKDLLQKKNSPFIQLKVLNPRYEKINVAINVKFQKGNTGEYFEKKLEQDIKQFLAPWVIGKTDRLEFGSVLSKSDLINFVERLSYVDFICQIDWIHEFDLEGDCTLREISCNTSNSGAGEFISPLTARSILTAGEVTVCELREHCESYDSNVLCEKDKGQVVL